MVFDGGDGNDIITAGDADDQIYGGTGNDKIEAGDGADYIKGGSGNDVINAGPGNDRIWGENGDDTIHGGAGNDEIDAGYGIDTLYADEGTFHKFITYDGGDTIYTGEGQNIIFFKGATTNGASTIDNLHPEDQLKFRNSCRKWKTYVVKQHIASKFDNDLTGPWTVSMNDGRNISICKADVCIGEDHDRGCK